jgi:hypothetical protein
MIEFTIKRINIHHKNNINYRGGDECDDIEAKSIGMVLKNIERI